MGYFGNLMHSAGTFTLDVDANAFSIGLFGGTDDPMTEPGFIPPFELWLEGLEWIGRPAAITAVELRSGSTFDGVTVDGFGSDAMTGESYIHLGFDGVVFPPVGLPFTFAVAVFDITTGPLSSTPEPAALALFGIAVAGLGALCRLPKRQV